MIFYFVLIIPFTDFKHTQSLNNILSLKKFIYYIYILSIYFIYL
jgi:uncharacterized membrane protein YraQ (UPF0718 family)